MATSCADSGIPAAGASCWSRQFWVPESTARISAAPAISFSPGGMRCSKARAKMSTERFPAILARFTSDPARARSVSRADGMPRTETSTKTVRARSCSALAVSAGSAAAAWSAGSALASGAPSFDVRTTSAPVASARTARIRSRLPPWASSTAMAWLAPSACCRCAADSLTSSELMASMTPTKGTTLRSSINGSPAASAAATMADGMDGRPVPVSMASAATPRSASSQM